jgi:retinol dehydrogenase-8
MKVVIITGCSTGIGRSLALSLASNPQKYTVYATMRNPSNEDLTPAAGANANKSLFIKQLDVLSDSSVHNLVKEVVDKEGRIDVLVNNAGLGLGGPFETISVDKAKENFDTNFFGVYRMMQAVVPHMKAKKSGQIINVSSVGGVNGVPFNDVYCAAKFALEGFSESLQPVLRSFNIKVNVIEPGPVKTAFGTNARANSGLQPGGDLPNVDDETKKLFGQVMQRMMTAFASDAAETSEECASKIQAVIEAENPPFRTQTNTSPSYELAVKAKFADVTGNASLDGMYKRFIE